MATQITSTRIETLRTEAAQAGDTKMVAICDRALNGSARATAECRKVIWHTEAQ